MTRSSIYAADIVPGDTVVTDLGYTVVTGTTVDRVSGSTTLTTVVRLTGACDGEEITLTFDPARIVTVERVS